MKFEPHRIVLGCANLGGLFLDGKKPDIYRAKEIIAEALRIGITRFDTAPLYGWGASEFFLGRAIEVLNPGRSDIYISSKSLRSLIPCIETRDQTQPDFWTLGEPNNRFTHRWGLDYDSIMQTTLRSLETLRTPYLDGLAFHDVGDAFQEFPAMSWKLFDEAARATRDLKKGGFVREIGFGGKESATLDHIIKHYPDLLTYASTTTYNLLDQSFAAGGSLNLCANNKIEYRAAGPFCSRLLATDPRTAIKCPGKDGTTRWYYNGNLDMPVTFNYGYISEHDYARACKVWEIVERFGEANPRAAALQFTLANPNVARIIIGAAEPSHLRDLVAAIERKINPGLWSALVDAEIIDRSSPLPS